MAGPQEKLSRNRCLMNLSRFQRVIGDMRDQNELWQSVVVVFTYLFGGLHRFHRFQGSVL